MNDKLQQLSQKLGHDFNDSALLSSALTHRSVKAENNERLEFLGDSIVNFVIAEALFKKFPKEREGKLSRLRANLVNGETLAEIAQEFELGQYLKLGPGEVKSGGHRRTSILADAVEAIIAAIYLDAGMSTANDCVLRWYATRLETVHKGKTIKDPKTRLQELLQAKKRPLPSYDIAEIKGDAHDQTFLITCRVEGLAHFTEGKGSSRRRAEQQAAREFLSYLDKHND